MSSFFVVDVFSSFAEDIRDDETKLLLVVVKLSKEDVLSAEVVCIEGCRDEFPFENTSNVFGPLVIPSFLVSSGNFCAGFS